MGTTDTAVHFDPGDAYDLHSWNVIYNIYDELMTIPPGGNQPGPSLAESCAWDDPKTYTCHLRKGVKFSDGSPLTSEDVAYSFQRSIEINGDQGVCSLFSSLADCGKWTGDEDLTTPDDTTVIVQPPPAGCDVAFHPDDGRRGVSVPSDTYPEKSRSSPTARSSAAATTTS